MEYEHNPEDENWQEKLMEALEDAAEAAEEAPEVPTIPATAELEVDIKVSGLTR